MNRLAATLLAAGLVLGTTTVSAAQSQLSIYAATLLEPNQKTAEVSTEELKQILASGSAVVFDSRPPMEYAISHIPGAWNVGQKPDTPMSLYVSDVAEVERQLPDRSAAIVLYCNGPFCGKSKRLSEELLAAGYTNVRRYQLGAPTWRALVGTMQVELAGVQYVIGADRTAWFLDARSADEFGAASLPGARNVPAAEVVAAKDDGRLPTEDHNTRIVVFGTNAAQARAAADVVAANAFHNVTFYAGSAEDLLTTLARSSTPHSD
jgi:rhodanese-related sulfurtransferase